MIRDIAGARLAGRPAARPLPELKEPVLLDLHFDGDAAHLFAQSPDHDDYAEYLSSARALRAAAAELRTLARIRPLEHFEHAWISRVLELVADPDAEPAVRRYVSQSCDQLAIERGALLTGHWHCPACGSPGSQWSPGCAQTFCTHPAPERRAHWDHCRVTTRDDLLTLMISEGYERVGRLSAAAELQTLQASFRRLLERAPTPLAAEFDRWSRDVHDAHAARAAEILEVAARLGSAVDLDGELMPERLLQSAMAATGYQAA